MQPGRGEGPGREGARTPLRVLPLVDGEGPVGRPVGKSMKRGEPVSDETVDQRTFKLVSVEKSTPPTEKAKAKGTWYRYVIRNELTSIQGFARGSRITVANNANRYVDALNAKNDPSRSAGPWATQRRKAAAATTSK